MSGFKTIDLKDIAYFQSIVGEDYCIHNSNDLDDYSRDYTEDLSFMPSCAVLPKSAQEISKILAYCNKNIIPVTPRGAGTSLSGGALPVHGGLVISTKRLNKVLEIDEQNFFVVTEPGVVNEDLRQKLQEKGLTYPPDPASKGSCFIGGNIAHSSGGPQALKYGSTKEYVLNLELVLPNGEIIWTGANTIKNSTGYNITQLVVGSEGTLGIVSKAVLKVIPALQEKILMVAGFENATDACATVAPLFMKGLEPALVELLDEKGVALAVKAKGLVNPFPPGKSFLMVGYDGKNREQFMDFCEQTMLVCEEYNATEVLLADTAEEQERYWDIRRSIGEVVKLKSIYKEEDTVVPRAHLPAVIQKVEELEKKYGFEAVCYGHAGDGNLHINILKQDLSSEVWENELPKAIRELFEVCKELGGTISGEHGIGYVQKQYMDIVLTQTHFDILKGIKNVFDPQGIMNPGKMIDE